MSSIAPGRLINGVVNAVSSVEGTLSSLVSPQFWYQSLQQASFRGVPFAVLSTNGKFGRRLAVHEYPYRDTPWIEDLGRATRRISFTGFLVSDDFVYGGGDVIAQRAAMVGACEQSGPGSLIHPTLGLLTVNCEDSEVTERWDKGRYFEIAFRFIESGQLQFPSVATDTASAADDAADDLDTAAASDFASAVTDALEQGAVVVQQASDAIGGFVDIATGVVSEATTLFGELSLLPGNLGLYAAGNNLNVLGTNAAAPKLTGTATVQSLIATGSAARVAVAASLDIVTTDTANMGADAVPGPTDVAADIQAAVAAVVAAIVDPASALRFVTLLANYQPSPPSVQIATVGAALITMNTACGNVCRRAALGALVRAATNYQPFSQNAAAAIQQSIIGLIDNEITVAGDNGEDLTYTALLALRLSTIQDLTARGADLAPMKVVRLNSSLPALTLANRLYQDATRASQLVLEAEAPHPAFLPVTFSALAR